MPVTPEEVRKQVAGCFEIPPAEARNSLRFREDLAADSIDMLALACGLETAFGTAISVHALQRFRSVHDVVDYFSASRGGIWQ